MCPVRESPAAMFTRFCSAIPTLKNFSGNLSLNWQVSVDFDKSASSTTTSSFVDPSSMRASAHPCLVSFTSRFVMVGGKEK